MPAPIRCEAVSRLIALTLAAAFLSPSRVDAETAIAYGLDAAAVTVEIIGAELDLGASLESTFDDIDSALSAPAGTSGQSSSSSFFPFDYRNLQFIDDTSGTEIPWSFSTLFGSGSFSQRAAITSDAIDGFGAELTPPPGRSFGVGLTRADGFAGSDLVGLELRNAGGSAVAFDFYAITGGVRTTFFLSDLPTFDLSSFFDKNPGLPHGFGLGLDVDPDHEMIHAWWGLGIGSTGAFDGIAPLMSVSYEDAGLGDRVLPTLFFAQDASAAPAPGTLALVLTGAFLVAAARARAT